MGAICFHHNDLDGRAAAAVVGLYKGVKNFVEVDYGRRFPVELVEPGDEVWIVDFNLQDPADWTELHSRCHPDHLHWFDHHETTHEPDFHVRGIRSTAGCGAVLVWQYLCVPPLPDCLSYIDAWDRWLHNDDSDVLDFVAGMEIEDTSPTSDLWSCLLNDREGGRLAVSKILDIQMRGHVINRYREAFNRQYLSDFGEVGFFLGHKALMVNVGKTSSKTFQGDARVDDVDLCVAYVWTGSAWRVSMYSDKIKVNTIARHMGGGGHPGAAGFTYTGRWADLRWGQRLRAPHGSAKDEMSHP